MDTLRKSFTTALENTSLLDLTRSDTTTSTTPSTAPFKVIGRGSAGTVFRIPGTQSALKKGSVQSSIWGDCQMTATAYNAVVACKDLLESRFPGVSIPRVPCVYEYIRDDDMDNWWAVNSSRFVNVEEGLDDEKRGFVFQMQLIPSLPRGVREALVRVYFPKPEIERALVLARNRHCLVRPYFGERRSKREMKDPPRSLENFPLRLDQLVRIGVDIERFAVEMAVGLAVVHWRACLDGMDIEFVIGRAATAGELPMAVPGWRAVEAFSVGAGDVSRRALHLWILDFDKASPIDFVGDWGACCARLVTAVTANDPYFPNPVREGKEERALWRVFEAAYLKAAAAVVEDDYRLDGVQRAVAETLPKKFIKAWKKRAHEQLDHEDGGFVQFE